jgi:hypothetical protein
VFFFVIMMLSPSYADTQRVAAAAAGERGGGGLLSVLQIDLSACADRKMVIFYVYLRYFLKKSRFHRTDT